MTEIRRLGRLILLAAAAVVPFAPTIAAQRPDTSVKGVTSAAARYLQDYQTQLTYLLADERYVQHVFGTRSWETGRREMTGELFVTFVPGDQFWISVHDVMEVDGQPIPDRDDFQRLLEQGTVANAARMLMERNARFNLGSVGRNFNEPTLGLRLLEAGQQPRVRFDRKSVDERNDVTLVTLTFRESAEPTLIKSKGDLKPVFASGEIVVEAASGRIRRTLVQWKYQSITARLVTEYALEPQLNIWVPTTFTERYERSDATDEVIVCEAEYTNYRRFESRVRIR